MESTGLFLKKEEVVTGMTLAICVAGKEEPETDEGGEPLLVKPLIGGVKQLGVRFYPWPLRRVGTVVSTNSFGFSGVRPDVRFMPTEVFTPAEAPANTEFVAYRNGKLVLYGDLGLPKADHNHKYCVRVRRREDGRYISWGGGAQWWQRECSLPEDVRFVPIGEIGTASAIFDPRSRRIF